MPSESESEWDDDDEYFQVPKAGRNKRRRSTRTRTRERSVASPVVPSEAPYTLSFSPLLDALQEHDGADTFDGCIEPLLAEYSRAVLDVQNESAQQNSLNKLIVPISRVQARRILDEFESGIHANSTVANLISRKLKYHPNPLRAAILCDHSPHTPDSPAVPILPQRSTAAVNPQVLDALYAIQTTPYANSFLSRLRGFQPNRGQGVIYSDWESRTPWMDLMRDIREHYTLFHPDCEVPVETEAPIDYSSLREDHIPQVHDLLQRVFWEGINVRDSLEYSPEKCTVIATYKRLVVGVALLSSPQETYITYLAVRAGWDNAQIATTMLYHLITLNPRKDVTLHVSINNPAMLLYNRFGFKAEEFIVGFYEDYLDTQSRASKNAFRLRLRQ